MVPQQVSLVERLSLSQRVPYRRFHCSRPNNRFSYPSSTVTYCYLFLYSSKTCTFAIVCHVCVCVCVCVRACVCACMRACVRVCASKTYAHLPRIILVIVPSPRFFFFSVAVLTTHTCQTMQHTGLKSLAQPQ